MSPLRAALAIAPGALLAGVAGGIAFPILPIVGVRAGLPLPFIGVILAANRAARVLVSPLVGAATDRFGGRRTLVAGLAIQIVVMALYVLGVTTGRPGEWFLLGRLLHGPGSACVFVAAPALALHAGGAEQGGRTAGAVAGAMALGTPLGLVVGGFLSDRWGDAATFELAMGAAAFAMVCAIALVPDLRVPLARRTLREVASGLGDRRLLAIGALNFAATFATGGMVLTTLALLVRERGVFLAGFGEKGSAGGLLGWMIVVEALAMPWLGRLGDRRRAHARIAAAGIALLVPSLVLVALARSVAGLALGLALAGLGSASLGPSLLALVGDAAGPERRGVAIGLLQVAGDLGGMLGPLVGTALFALGAPIPYLATAALVAAFAPVGVWLTRRTSAARRRVDQPVIGSSGA